MCFKSFTTFRRAVIKSCVEKGVSYDGLGTIDSNPDREVIFIDPLNCTHDEFIDWFLTVNGWDFVEGGDGALIEIGVSSLDLSPGTILSVSFDKYFECWLESEVDSIKLCISRQVDYACEKVVETHDVLTTANHG